VDRPTLLARIVDLVLGVQRPHPLRVGIDGHSAAGKTTLADGLAALVEARGRPVIRATLDDFHRPASERYVRGRLSAEGFYLDTFDVDAARSVLLEPLGPTGNLRYQIAVFDAFQDVPLLEPEREAPPNAVLLLDGCFLFRPELNDVWDFRIFLYIDAEEVMRRGPLRDAAWMDSLEVAQTRYRERYLPGEQLYLDAVQPETLADVVIDNNDVFNPHFVRSPTNIGTS
jgi:uridine kinase